MLIRISLLCIVTVAGVELGTRLGAVARETVRQWDELRDVHDTFNLMTAELASVRRRLSALECGD